MVSTNCLILLPARCRRRTSVKRVILPRVGGSRFPMTMTAAHMADFQVMVGARTCEIGATSYFGSHHGCFECQHRLI